MQHGTVGHGGKAETSVLLRDDHAEELVFLQKFPGLGIQVGVVVADLPGVQHGAEFIDGSVEECLLFDREIQIRLLFQQLPVGFAGEQFAFPAYRACVQGHLLGLGNRGQHASELLQERTTDQLLPPGFEIQRHCDDRENRSDQNQAYQRNGAGGAHYDDASRHRDGPHQQARAVKSAGQGNSQQNQKQ